MAGPSLFRPGNITSNLKGYWKLDEASGSRADSSGNSNTLTDNNTVTAVAKDYWKSGENSADFERANSEFLSITDASQTGLDLHASDITFAFWVKLETLTGDSDIIAKGGASQGYLVRLSGGSIQLFVESASNVCEATSAITAAGRWHHVAITFNNTSNEILIYLDGNLVKSGSTSNTITNGTADFFLGKSFTGTDFLDGLLKDVGIWAAVLTPLQIKSLAMGVDMENEAFRPSSCATPPTHWWKLNEASGQRNDSIGSAHLTDKNTVLASGGYAEGIAADFETSNSESLHASDSSDWNLGTGDMTLSLWIKPEGTITGGTAIIAQTQSSGTFDERWGISYSATNIRLYNITGGSPTIDHDKTCVITSGVWHHILIRRSGTTFETFLDGVSIGTTTDASSFDNFTGDFYIGQLDAVGGEGYFDGLIADFGYWKGYAVTNDEVKKLASCFPLQQTGIPSYWKLNEASGSRSDSIGSNTLSDVNTVSAATGKVGDAADFESTNSEELTRTNAAIAGTLDFTDEITIACWFKMEASADMNIVSRTDGVANSYFMLLFDLGGGRQLRGTMRAGGTTTGVNGTTVLSAGVWYHGVVVLDGAAVRIYLNALLENSGAHTAGIGVTGADLFIGGTGSNYFDGLLDELILAGRYFRQEEVKNLYIKGSIGEEATSDPTPAPAANGNMFLVF